MVIAFDIRVPLDVANSELPSEYKIRALLDPSHTDIALSVDETIWPQIARDRFDELIVCAATELGRPEDPASICDSNDLMSRIPDRWLREDISVLPNDACLVALAVSPATVEYLTSLRKRGLVYESSINAIRLQQYGWRLLGYDVGDKMLYSPLLNADLGCPEHESITHEFRSKVNRHGLFVECGSADLFCRVAERYIPDHAPYFAIGLWTPSRKM